MSPYSVSTVMAMLSTGAKGETLKQMKKVFSFPKKSIMLKGYKTTIPHLNDNKDIILKTGINIFVMKGFSLLSDFKKDVKENFKSDVETVDFTKSTAAAKKINEWAEEMTNKKIKNVVSSDSLGPDTGLVLVNAIYFKGDWASKFDPKRTKAGTFHVSKDKTVEVPMMRMTSRFKIAVFRDFGCSMLEMPYKGERVVMQIILPSADKEIITLDDVEEKLKEEDIRKVFEEKSFKGKVDVTIPKFKFTSTIDLNEPLQSMGAEDMFSAKSADLSGVSGKSNLFVTQVVQKAFIEVNEEGSEAAAVTVVQTNTRSISLPTIFKADRPFMFFIRDNQTGMLLFQGRVSDPSL